MGKSRKNDTQLKEKVKTFAAEYAGKDLKRLWA